MMRREFSTRSPTQRCPAPNAISKPLKLVNERSTYSDVDVPAASGTKLADAPTAPFASATKYPKWAVLPVGFKPLVDLMQQCREAGVPIYV